MFHYVRVTSVGILASLHLGRSVFFCAGFRPNLNKLQLTALQSAEPYNISDFYQRARHSGETGIVLRRQLHVKFKKNF